MHPICNEHKFQHAAHYFHPDLKSHRAQATITGSEYWLKGFSYIVANFMPNFRADLQCVDKILALSYVSGAKDNSVGSRRLSVDMFQILDNRILEHWDVQQDVYPNVCGT